MKPILTAIPHYNNARTIVQVVTACLEYTRDIVVVDDGSTGVVPPLPVPILRHPENRGKGQAILTALQYASHHHYDYLIVLDADGQHLPEDLPRFQRVIQDAAHETLVVGCRNFQQAGIPRASRFGRSFSNFWVKLETGVVCADTQSGFRAYPVRAALQLNYLTRRYDFEIEILVRLLWGGVRLQEVPVQVRYAPPDARVSHFRPLLDNLRLTLLHTLLVAWNLLPIPHRRVTATEGGFQLSILKHPVKFLKFLLTESATPHELAHAAAVGTLVAVLPIFGFHTWVILYLAIKLRLNKVLSVAIQNLYAPPFAPFLCVELGYWLRHREFLTSATPQELLRNAHILLYEWFLGSLILGPVCAVITWLLVYFVASGLMAKEKR